MHLNTQAIIENFHTILQNIFLTTARLCLLGYNLPHVPIYLSEIQTSPTTFKQ